MYLEREFISEVYLPIPMLKNEAFKIIQFLVIFSALGADGF